MTPDSSDPADVLSFRCLRSALRHQWKLLAVLLLLAAALRFWNLGSDPPGLFRDEAEKGYTALELWKTGRHGEFHGTEIVPTRFLPAFVEVGGVQTSAIYQYLSAPVVGIFGLNRTTTRFIAALSGTLTVFFTWALAVLLCERRSSASHALLPVPRPSSLVPFFAILFIAVSPTHVLFSRWAQQGITVPLFFTLGIVGLLTVPALREKNRRAIAALAGFAIALAFYAYEPARLVIPVILLGLWWEMRSPFRSLARNYWPAAVTFLLFAIPIAVFAATAGSARFTRLSIFAGQSLPDALLLFAENYIRHFDPRFLFIHGDANPRHSLPFAGLLAWAEAPFFLLGLFTLRHAFRSPLPTPHSPLPTPHSPLPASGARLLLIWLLAAPLAASFTRDGIPHALRSILFFPAVHLISARGVALLAARLRERIVLSLLAVAGMLTLALDIAALAGPVARDGYAWQYGPLEALAAMDRENPNGPNVLLTDYAHYYILFHEQPDPRDFHERGLAALRTQVLPPGAPLPPRALVAHPPFQMFEKPQDLDIRALGAEPSDPPAMMIRRSW